MPEHVNDSREIAASTRPDGLLVFGRSSGGSRVTEDAYLGEGPNEDPRRPLQHSDLGRGHPRRQRGHRKSGNFGFARYHLAELLLILEDGDAVPQIEAQYEGYLPFGSIAAAGTACGL